MAVALQVPVTSVALTVPNIFSVSGSPITSAGTLAVSLVAQTQNLVWAAPNGSSGNPSFRALVANDIPSILNGTSFGGAIAIGGGLSLYTNTVSANYSLV